MQFDAAVFESVLDSLSFRYKKDILMSSYTTFRIGGRVRYALFPDTKEMLICAPVLCHRHGLACALVGCASNLLWQDEPFDGCVIFTTEMKTLSVSGETVTAEAGATLSSVCLASRDAALAGLSFAFGIPGSVGGAVYMNAGAYGGEVGDRIVSVTYFDPDMQKTHTVPAAECAFGYRDSVFRHTKRLILSADFALCAGDRAQIRREMDDYMSRRRDKQPLNYPSAGSAFKRYPGYFTAKLIDEAGLRGYTVGGAQISDKHAGFIVNRGGATASDVLALMEDIQNRIEALHGIRIEPEIRLTDDCII